MVDKFLRSDATYQAVTGATGATGATGPSGPTGATGATGAAGGLLSVTVGLDAADILALDVTPILVLDGIADNVINVVYYSASLTYSGSNFSFTGGDINGYLNDITGPVVISGTMASTGFLDQTHDMFGGATGDPVQVAAETVVGEALILQASAPIISGETGPILTSSINDGGSGFAVGNTFFIDAGDANATGVVDTVDGGGTILTYHLTDNGTNYVTNTDINIEATSGVGMGATIDLVVGDPAGTLRVTVWYTLHEVQ